MPTRNQPRVVNQAQQSRRIDSEEKLLDYVRTMLGEPMITVDVSDEQILLLIDDTVRKFSDFAYGGEQRIAFIVEGMNDVQDYILDRRVQAVLSVSFANSLGASSFGAGAGGINLGPGWGTIGVGYVPHITMQGEVSSLSVGGAGGGACSTVTGGVAGGVSQGSRMDGVTNAYASIAQRDTLQAMLGRGVNFEFNSNSKILRVFEALGNANFIVEASAEYVPNPDFDEVYAHPWVKDYAVSLTRRLWSTVTGKYSQALVGGAEINYDKMQSEAEQMIEKLDEDLLNKYSEALGIFSG